VAELTRTQIAVYGAVAVALLLVGARAIAHQPGRESETAFGSTQGGGSGSSAGLTVDESGGRDVVVDVAGAVRRPGVYRLPDGARVTDAVERAGGATGAALEQINLAAHLADGQQIVVPAIAPEGTAAPTTAAAGADEGPISLGSATPEQLDTIEGIGPVTAEDIIGFRDQHGGLSSIEQLDQISGIGPATMEALRKRLQP
jgi:competence protein ComEA